MTENDKAILAHGYEKRWHESKKFIAFLLMEIMFCAMSMVALFEQDSIGWPLSAFMTGIVIAMGFIALSFNGKQAQLDMYVRAMALTGGIPEKMKASLGVTAPPKDTKPTLPDPIVISENPLAGPPDEEEI